MDTLSAVSKFEDESVDFIFQDAYLSYEQAMEELKAWYPKLRSGGIYSGHDYNDPKITRAVNEFRENERIGARMSIADDCWMWYKP
jgi:predicted SAM-dependent methyltransferase